MKDANRKLYGGTEDVAIARDEISKGSGDKEVALRVYDVIGGDALVFLTPGRVRRLIADLAPYARTVIRRKAHR